jgi:hypothetical protein
LLQVVITMVIVYAGRKAFEVKIYA